MITEVIPQLERAAEGKMSGTPTGFPSLDRLTAGWHAGEVSDIQEIRSKKNSSVPPEAKELAEALRSRILENDAKARISPSQLVAWAHEADRMMRIDGRDKAEIMAVIEWSQRDSFWLTTILSMKNLRKHFGRLSLQMKSQQSSNGAGRRWNGGDLPAAMPRRNPAALSPKGEETYLNAVKGAEVLPGMGTA